MQTINLTSHFLIAMPAMSDPNFSRTLTFICEHNERGALGIVVNRPIEVTLASLFRRWRSRRRSPLADQPVFYGGPVQFDHGFVLHRPVGAWKSTLPVGEIGPHHLARHPRGDVRRAGSAPAAGGAGLCRLGAGAARGRDPSQRLAHGGGRTST
jgi:hypothetical protein